MPDAPPPGSRIAIIAGGGTLPGALRAHLVERGHDVTTIAVAGEAGAEAPDATVSIADVEGMFRALERARATHAVLVGWIRRRPRFTEGRIGRRSIAFVPRFVRALTRGDDAILRAVVEALEARGVTVLGVHEVWPELLAEQGPLGRFAPTSRDEAAIALGREASQRLGELDAGQAVVVVGRRIVALEGLEGTDEMLARVRALRDAERIKAKARSGVLVKTCKPGQERRADLPTIGPSTVEAAIGASLAGIAVEAGSSLVLDRERTVAIADRGGLFLHGIPGNEE